MVAHLRGGNARLEVRCSAELGDRLYGAPRPTLSIPLVSLYGEVGCGDAGHSEVLGELGYRSKVMANRTIGVVATLEFLQHHLA